jgi:hypothetical protein
VRARAPSTTRNQCPTLIRHDRLFELPPRHERPQLHDAIPNRVSCARKTTHRRWVDVARSLPLFARMSTTLRFMLVAAVICIAVPAHADLAAVYLQGNGGLASGRVNQPPEGGASPDYGPAFGAQLGARVLFGEGYIDHTAFSGSRGVTRYVLGVRGGVGLGDIKLFLRGGVGYLSEHGGALAGELMPMRDRRGFIARGGGGVESSLGGGFYLGGAVEAEYFHVSPHDASMFGDEARSGTDMFGYLYLKLQFGL